jgi:hypothetical protein
MGVKYSPMGYGLGWGTKFKKSYLGLKYQKMKSRVLKVPGKKYRGIL